MLLRLGRSAGTQAVAEAAAPRPELCFGSFAPWFFKRGPLKGSIRDTIRDTIKDTLRDTLRVLYCLVLSRAWGWILGTIIVDYVETTVGIHSPFPTKHQGV